MARFNLECISERPISQSGQRGAGDRKSLGKGKKKTSWTTDGDGWRSGSLSAFARGKQVLFWNWPYNSPVCRLRGKAWGSQPCLPREPPCLRRQDPSSVSKAIFTKAWKLLLLSLRLSCEGMKHRQIPSLEPQRSQHLISTLCARHKEGILCVPDHRGALPILHEAAVFTT